jgi:hypothetical protein
VTKLNDKERLESIKKQFQNTIIKLGRNNGKIQFINDFDWLLKQAEKLSRLEQSFMSDEYKTIDYLRLSAEIFEGKEPPKRLNIRN